MGSRVIRLQYIFAKLMPLTKVRLLIIISERKYASSYPGSEASV